MLYTTIILCQMVIICDVILQYTVTVSLYYVIGLAYGSSRTHTPDDSRDIFLFVSAIPPSCVLTLDFLSSARRSRRPSNCSEGTLNRFSWVRIFFLFLGFLCFGSRHFVSLDSKWRDFFVMRGGTIRVWSYLIWWAPNGIKMSLMDTYACVWFFHLASLCLCNEHKEGDGMSWLMTAMWLE